MPAFATLTAQEAAAMITHGQQVSLSGFTVSGTPQAVPRALAERASAEHAAGRPFQVRLLTGASTGPADDLLAEAKAISWRAPFQGSAALRKQINAGQVAFADLHLSHVPQYVDFGFAGKVDWAIVEATEVTPDGRVFLTAGVGITPTVLKHASKVIIEVNRAAAPRLREMHDIAMLAPPPERGPIPIMHAMQRIGVPYASVDPRKIVGVVEVSESPSVSGFDAPNEASAKIAEHIVAFLASEMRAGRIPREFLPVQAGVGNVSNAVLAAMGSSPDLPAFEMYTEVMQDSQVELMERGRITGVSTCALTLSDEAMARVVSNIDAFAPKIVLRPQELSNNPGVIRRLGVIAINTVLELDIYGCANSTHVGGTMMMNGIGGSGDFTRNAYISILMAPSVAKNGAISALVPMVSHVDHTEHSVQVFVTEQGLADLRGLGPIERARLLIAKCAHPMYRDYLSKYLESARPGHQRHDLQRVFELHENFARTGKMLPG
jgi:succinate CoA transferase